jgi:hypothetical protein
VVGHLARTAVAAFEKSLPSALFGFRQVREVDAPEIDLAVEEGSVSLPTIVIAICFGMRPLRRVPSGGISPLPLVEGR